MLRRLWRRRIVGFTLTELVVVITIIALLGVLLSCSRRRPARSSSGTSVGLLGGSLAPAMLFPALMAAREKARRTACMSNLQQIGDGLEGYLSDYGDYFPSWQAAEIKHIRVTGDSGLYKDPVLGQTTEVSPATGGDEHNARRFATTAVGRWRGIAQAAYDGRRPPNFGKGDLNAAPVNLGYVLILGYMPDAAVFYCPTATRMPVEKLTGLDCQSPNLTLLNEFMRLGGTDGRMLTHGDWSWVTAVNAGMTGEHRFKTAIGQYNYRCAANVGYGRFDQVFTVAGTRPRVISTMGSPAFRTARMLGARALLSDTFDKGWRAGWPDGPKDMGAALFHHKDGYNVLYGDYHTQWYGDPQHRISSWPPCDQPPGWPHAEKAKHPMTSIEKSLSCSALYPSSGITGAHVVWHMFDEALGIDVGIVDY